MDRLFVGVWPPPTVVDELEGLVDAASRSEREVRSVCGEREVRTERGKPEARWIAPAQWHVTLAFLGRADVGEATEALARVAAPAAEAVLGPRVERLGSAVVCVPVTGLDALAASVAEAFAGVGEPQPDRAFRGHLTLARLKGRRRCSLVGTEVSGTFVVSEVTLVRSRLDSAGARYEVLATRPLAH